MNNDEKFIKLGEKMSVYLEQGNKVEVVIPGKGVVHIDSDGMIEVDAGTHGYKKSLFDFEKCENTSVASKDTSKKNEISEYMYLLFESQKCGHDVHQEIDEALKKFRDEAGI